MANNLNITHTKPNNFVKEISNPVINKEYGDGEKVTRPFKGSVIPGTGARRRIKYVLNDRKFPIDIEPEKLNELVKEMSLFDEDGEPITEANVRNIQDKFFAHEEMVLEFEGGTALIDKDSPKGIIWANYMENHPDFKTKGVKGEHKGIFDGKALYTYVENKSLDKAVEEEELDELDKATELIATLDFSTKKKILRGLGVQVEGEVEPKQVKRHLIKKVIREAENTSVDGRKTNLQLFLHLAESSPEELNLTSIIKEARDKRVIVKQSSGDSYKYKFGEIPLGNTLDKVKEFLKDKDNSETLTDIQDAIGD